MHNCAQTIDGRNVHGLVQHPDRDAEVYRQRRREERDEEMTWPRRTVVDVENMARDAFFRVDDIHNNVFNDDGATSEDADTIEEDEQWSQENLEYLLRESTQPVFEGSSLNHLQCAIVLFSLCNLYSVPQTFMDALFTWIAGDLLPTSNFFPRTSYEVKIDHAYEVGSKT